MPFLVDVVGVAVLATPLVAMVVFWLAGLPQGRMTMDYLLPFEIFPVTLLGVVLILAGSLWSKEHRRLVIWAVVAAALLAGATLVWAQLSGIANAPDLASNDWRLILADVGMGLACLALVAILVAGVLTAVAIRREGAAGKG